MRLSDLVGRDVVDEDGTHLGKAHDVRLVQDGPMLGTWGAAFRVDALVVGPRSLATRLGLDRSAVRGPWLVRASLARLGRAPVLIPWDDVRSVGDEHIVVAAGEYETVAAAR